VYVQGESLKAHAALLTEASQLPDHQRGVAFNAVFSDWPDRLDGHPSGSHDDWYVVSAAGSAILGQGPRLPESSGRPLVSRGTPGSGSAPRRSAKRISSTSGTERPATKPSEVTPSVPA
jgi:hypothetical protein